MTQRLKAHPAAELFPMMGEAELDELASDIKENGQHHPIIVTTGNLVLDGRNRLEACARAGVAPEVLMWDREDDGISATSWVLSQNLRRRHLNESQRALIAAEALPLFEQEASARRRKGAERGGSRSAPRGALLPPKKRASAEAAKTVAVGARSVERAKAVLSKRPELAPQVKAGKMTLKQAEKAIRREEQQKQVLEYRPPQGLFSVISTDVPWQYDDALDGSDQARAGTPYPTMTLDEICAIKLPAASDCALWFWVTNSFLIDGSAARVLRAWAFEPKSLMTWIKDRMGAGHYLRNQTEHCILAVRGKPLILGSDVPNFFHAPRRAHSEKPDEFYKIVEKVCPAKERLELFARREREGWKASGAELPKKRRFPIIDVAEA